MNPPAASNRRKAFFGILLAGTNLLCLGGGIVFGRITGGGGKTEVDLSVVRDSVTAAAFYELVFDPDAPATMHKALVPDPITKVRARPLHPGNGQAGPHDALGFRSEGVANDLEIVTIGDSQTYGWNVAIADTWPSRLAELSGKPVYNMALGGWGGAQYRYIAEKALRFKVKDGEILFPKNSAGRNVVAEGVLKKIELTQQQAVAWAKHEAEERGEKFDAAKIKSGMTMYQIQGSGAVLLD